MHAAAIRLLRPVLLLALIGSVAVQVLVPVVASGVGERFPEVRHLVVPYSAAAIAWIGCVQAALLATWRLLSMSGGRLPVTRGAVRWVSAILGAAVVATLLSAAVLVHLQRSVPGGGGPMLLYVTGGVGAGLAVTLLALAMRRRLVSGSRDRRGREGAT